MAAKERTKENCRCFDAADPRLGGCTPPRPPKRRSEVSAAKRTQYYCPFLTPPSLPPIVNSGVPPNPRRGEVKAPLSKGAGRVSGLGDSDGLCRTARYTRRRPGIPPSRLRSAPPFDKGGFSRGLRPCKKAPHAVGSWPSLRGLRGFDGLYVTTRQRVIPAYTITTISYPLSPAVARRGQNKFTNFPVDLCYNRKSMIKGAYPHYGLGHKGQHRNL